MCVIKPRGQQDNNKDKRILESVLLGYLNDFCNRKRHKNVSSFTITCSHDNTAEIFNCIGFLNEVIYFVAEP